MLISVLSGWQEIYYYCGEGNHINTDNITAEKMVLEAQCNPDNETLQSLTDGGPLTSGALPAAPTAGGDDKSLWEAMGGPVAKAKAKPKLKDEKSEKLEPKTDKENLGQTLSQANFDPKQRP